MFKGVFTSLITPFSKGEVDYIALGQMVEKQLLAGVHGLVILSEPAEGFLLTKTERKNIISSINRFVRNRLSVVVDCTAISTKDAVENAKIAQGEGASAIVLTPPPYIRPSQDGIIEHFLTIGRFTKIPLGIWNAPKKCSCQLELPTIVRLAKHSCISALVANENDVNLIHKLKPLLPVKFQIAADGDCAALSLFAAGASAIISQSSSIIPEKWISLWESCIEGNWASAQKIQRSLAGLHEALTIEPGSGSIKAALYLTNQCCPELRLPLMWPLRSTIYRIAAELETLGINIKNGELS